MRSNILIFGPQYFKDNSVVENNVADDVIEVIINKAQKVRIEPILGTDLYNKILNDISGSTLSGNYVTLVDEYIIPALIEWVQYDGTAYFNYKFTNKSVLTKNSEQSAAVGLDEIKYLRDGMRDMSEYLSQRITNYIKTNPSYFPEYYTNSTIDDIKPKSTVYFSGLYLGRTGNCDIDNLGIGIPLN